MLLILRILRIKVPDPKENRNNFTQLKILRTLFFLNPKKINEIIIVNCPFWSTLLRK